MTDNFVDIQRDLRLTHQLQIVERGDLPRIAQYLEEMTRATAIQTVSDYKSEGSDITNAEVAAARVYLWRHTERREAEQRFGVSPVGGFL